MNVTGARLDRLDGQLGDFIARHSKAGRRDWRKEYSGRPVAFMREALDFHPTPKQVEIIESFQHHKRTVVRGHHGAGKDAVLAALMLYAAYVLEMQVVAISATERQLLGQLWAEMARLWRGQPDFRGELFVGELRIDGDKRIVAMTSGSTSNLTGWHNPRGTGVFVAVSESQAEQVGNFAFDAAEANTAGEGSRIVVVGNPVEPSGRFFEVHHRTTWHKVHMPASSHPNIIEGRMVVPGGPAPGWPADVAAECGPDSPFYRSRVDAEFPSEATDALITRAMWDRATELHRTGALAGEAARSHHVLGVDPARLGPDSTAVAIRRGPVVEGFEQWRGHDTMATVDRVMGIARRLLEGYSAGPGGGAVEAVIVDEVGLGGGILDRLRELLPGLEWSEYRVEGFRPDILRRSPSVRGFSAGELAINPARFRNKRAESFWHFRKLLEDGRLALPDVPELREELLATRARFGPDGKTDIEPKDAIRARLGRSPDLADSLVISLAPLIRSAAPRVRWC